MGAQSTYPYAYPVTQTLELYEDDEEEDAELSDTPVVNRRHPSRIHHPPARFDDYISH